MNIVIKKNGKNSLRQKNTDDSKVFKSIEEVLQSWESAVCLTQSGKNNPGLRSAQIGALCAIKSYWTVSSNPATIVMPTGTGKTETMIATVVIEMIKRTLIIVPSDLLRTQTCEKFVGFGVLKQIGVVKEDALYPCVTELKSTPKSLEEFKGFVLRSNVIVTTMSLLQRFPEDYFELICSSCDTVIIDEAHHIAAKSWSTVKYRLRRLRCLQFTATPFRKDGKKVDGKIIYNFPLSLAQKQNYFQPIDFKPIWEFDPDKGDLSIARAAVSQLEYDIECGFDHVVLVRAKDKRSANKLYDNIYNKFFQKYNPVLIHSDISRQENKESLQRVKKGRSKIVVCVDMFGEGIDIPNLKIAAMHDKYKSLPITLQFIGRFARSSQGLGKATFITNIANNDISEALEELYSQDADWNFMLQNLSSKEISKELALQELSEGFDFALLDGMSVQQLRPKISMTAYRISESEWNIDVFRSLFDLDKSQIIVNADKNVIVAIEKSEKKVDWTTYRGMHQSMWELHIIYWNKLTKMLFVNSTLKGFSDDIAKSLFRSAARVNGEEVFKCLYGINRLMLGTVGLKSALEGPVRYKMFAGVDVGNGIAMSQKETSMKSNLFGVGYQGAGKISIGCSYKGTIWSRWVESVQFWMDWCDEIATKLNDPSIDTTEIFSGALIPEIVSQRPESNPYIIEWPIELEFNNEEYVFIEYNGTIYNIYETEIRLLNNSKSGDIGFLVGNNEFCVEYKLVFEEQGVIFIADAPLEPTLVKGRHSYKLSEFFDKEPPSIKFADQSTLMGNVLITIPEVRPSFNKDDIFAWDWSGIDIHKESQGVEKASDSIQYHVISKMKSEELYDVIFDDDGPGEIADIVCIKAKDNLIKIDLFHCKYATGAEPGARVKDLYEVCGQAEKAVKWCQNYEKLIDHMNNRERKRLLKGSSRFELGSVKKLKELKNMMRFYRVELNMYIVQPGIDATNISDDMNSILNGTAAYLLETYNVSLKIISS